MDAAVIMSSLLLSICILLLQQGTAAVRDAELYCGACQAMVDEVEYAISEVDQRKTIEIGFRIDPQGRQKVKKIPYAGSEVHLMELLEEICSKLRDYGESKDPDTSARKYVRFNSRKEGDPVELKNINIKGDISRALDIACQNIIEEYEEEIVGTFLAKEPNTKTMICNEIAGVCTDSDEAENDVSSEKTEL